MTKILGLYADLAIIDLKLFHNSIMTLIYS
jgi:hypothetical protein